MKKYYSIVVFLIMILCSLVATSARADDSEKDGTFNFAPLFDGRDATIKAINKYGSDMLPTYMACRFSGFQECRYGYEHLYIDPERDGFWYLPSIGEWMDVYGVDVTQVTGFLYNTGNSGATGQNISKVNDALRILKNVGYQAETLQNGYISISKTSHTGAGNWRFDATTGNRRFAQYNTNTGRVRVFRLVKNYFNPDVEDERVEIGDVVLENVPESAQRFVKRENITDNMAGTPIGVVVWVSPSGRSAKIINLGDFSVNGSAVDPEGFNAANPYGYTKKDVSYCRFSYSGECYYEIPGSSYDITVIPETRLMPQISSLNENEGNCSITFDPLFDGATNTIALYNKFGENCMASLALNYWEVSENDENFGKGKWYLPAIGELLESYGIDYSKAEGNDYPTGINKQKIQQAVNELRHVDEDMADNPFATNSMSSTEGSSNRAWYMSGNGYFKLTGKGGLEFHPFLLLQDKFDGDNSKIKIGDIVYPDLSYGSAADYDSSFPKPVGVVAWVSPSGRSVKIISLKRLNKEYPYEAWGSEDVDVEAIKNYGSDCSGGCLANKLKKVNEGFYPAYESCKKNSSNLINLTKKTIECEGEWEDDSECFKDCCPGKAFDMNSFSCKDQAGRYVYLGETEGVARILDKEAEDVSFSEIASTIMNNKLMTYNETVNLQLGYELCSTRNTGMLSYSHGFVTNVGAGMITYGGGVTLLDSYNTTSLIYPSTFTPLIVRELSCNKNDTTNNNNTNNTNTQTYHLTIAVSADTLSTPTLKYQILQYGSNNVIRPSSGNGYETYTKGAGTETTSMTVNLDKGSYVLKWNDDDRIFEVELNDVVIPEAINNKGIQFGGIYTNSDTVHIYYDD